MPAQPKMYLTARAENVKVGNDLFLKSFFRESDYGVVFEDNGETGYFYAVHKENGILDALGIYNVSGVTDKEIPSEIKIFWNKRRTLAALDINGFVHAVFDFSKHAGYCRSAFPEHGSNWTRDSNRLLDDKLLKSLLAAA